MLLFEKCNGIRYRQCRHSNAFIASVLFLNIPHRGQRGRSSPFWTRRSRKPGKWAAWWPERTPSELRELILRPEQPHFRLRSPWAPWVNCGRKTGNPDSRPQAGPSRMDSRLWPMRMALSEEEKEVDDAAAIDELRAKAGAVETQRNKG